MDTLDRFFLVTLFVGFALVGFSFQLRPDPKINLERDCSLVGTHVINDTTAIQCVVLKKVNQPEVERKSEPKLGEGI